MRTEGNAVSSEQSIEKGSSSEANLGGHVFSEANSIARPESSLASDNQSSTSDFNSAEDIFNMDDPETAQAFSTKGSESSSNSLETEKPGEEAPGQSETDGNERPQDSPDTPPAAGGNDSSEEGNQQGSDSSSQEGGSGQVKENGLDPQSQVNAQRAQYGDSVTEDVIDPSLGGVNEFQGMKESGLDPQGQVNAQRAQYGDSVTEDEIDPSLGGIYQLQGLLDGTGMEGQIDPSNLNKTREDIPTS